MADKKEKKKKTGKTPVRNLDFNTLQICKDSFLNKKLAKYFSDILYQANLNEVHFKTGIKV